MRVCIIGGNGFIGSHIQDVLLSRGHAVRVLDMVHELYREPLPDVDYRVGSSADESSRLTALLGIDAVMYLASTTVPATSNLDIAADIQSNLVPLAATLDAMIKVGVARIAYFSSGGTVYGPTDRERVPEEARLEPICSYGIVKVAAEKYLGMYRHLHRIAPVILRPSNPFGPRQGHRGVQGFVGTSLARMLRGEPLEIWGDGSVVRDYIYVGDVALAAVLALEADVVGPLNIGRGIGSSLTEVVDVLAAATGVTPEVRFRAGRAVDVPRAVLDVSRARESLGWAPATSLLDGVATHWDWLRSEAELRAPDVD